MNLPTKPVVPAIKIRWSFIALPLAVLTVSIISTAVFLPRLPADVAYHFKSDGSPDRSMPLGMIIMVTLLPQILLTAVAAGTTVVMVWFSSRFEQIISGIKPVQFISLMGNIVSLPQIVLFFFSLDIFLYNTFKFHLLPGWALGAVVMIIGGVVLAVFFTRTLREVKRPTH
jgi:uncharacterized membrane protein